MLTSWVQIMGQACMRKGHKINMTNFGWFVHFCCVLKKVLEFINLPFLFTPEI